MPSPSGIFLATDFGAVGDAATLNTRALQAALDAAAERGGVVLVPAGTFLTGTLFLRSHVTLELAQNARLLGSPNLQDYTAVRWGHHMDRTPWHLLVADGVHHVVLRGEGEVDGNGPCFWEKERPSEWHFFRERWQRVSPMVEFTRCTDVRVEGLALRNSAGWGLHLHDTDRAFLHGLTISNTLFGPNSDGIDLTGCRDVLVSDCHISTGDDAIALKTTVDSRACEYITVTNCVLETNCVAFRVGFESREDFRHITFGNSVIKNCSRAVDLRSVEGSIIEHVTIHDISGTTNCGWPVNRPIEVCLERYEIVWNLRPEHARHGLPVPPVKRGAIRHISLTNIDLVTDGRVMIGAAPGEELRDLNITNLRLTYPMLDDPLPLCARLSPQTSFYRGLPGLRAARAAVVVENAQDLVLRDLRIEWPTYPVPDDWNLLRSPQRFIAAELYRGNEERIRKGELRPPFQALWARGLRGGRIDLRDVSASEPGLPKADLADCTAVVDE